MPYQDRVSWVHVVSFAAPPVTTSPAPLARPGGPTLAATGPEALPAVLGACLLPLAVALARRRTRAS